MDDSRQEVVKGPEIVDDAGRALNSIYAAVERQAQMIESIARAANEQAQVSESVAVAMGQISEITHQTNTGAQEASMSVSYLAELADQLRTSVSTFCLPERANEMVDVYPSMAGVPALPAGDSDQYYQQDMGAYNDWNQGFSSDFLSLPQPQEPDGTLQYAFSNQQDFGPVAGFGPQSGNQAFGSQQGFDTQQFGFGGQQGFDNQQYGNQAFGGQQGFDNQQYGNQAFANPQGFHQYSGGSDQNSGDRGGFDHQQSFEGQSQFDFAAEGFGNQNQSFFPGANQIPRVPQQSFGSQSGPRSHMRNPQQNQSSYSQDQVPFPNRSEERRVGKECRYRWSPYH